MIDRVDHCLSTLQSYLPQFKEIAHHNSLTYNTPKGIPAPWKLAGFGKYSIVLSHPLFRKMVVKLTIKDFAYRAYINLVQDIESPHKPVLYHQNHEGEFSLYLLEKLHNASDASWSEVMGYERARKFGPATLLEMALANPIENGILRGGEAYPGKQIEYPSGNSFCDYIIQMGQHLRMRTGREFSVDLHYGNVLWRNGKRKDAPRTLVITDPIAFGKVGLLKSLETKPVSQYRLSV